MKDISVKEIIKKEKLRQKTTINLIASENFVSKDVLEALGTEFTNKYAEGYAGARYYGGNKYSDEIENLCKERALKVFRLNKKSWAVNVQALSGSPANLAVYTAILPRNAKIFGMSLDSGGHLSHGHIASVTGKWWKQIPYEVDRDSEMLDYNKLCTIALKEKPDIIVAGFTAYSRKINWKELRNIADEVGAHLHIDMSHIAGLVAGGVISSPFPYADTVMTTTHKTLRGPRGALIFSRVDERGIPAKIDKVVFPGLQGGPHMNQTAAIAVALFEVMQPSFKKYALQVIKNTKVLAEELKSFGWRIVSNGTDTHLFLVDTWREGIGGAFASEVLEKNGIIVNKNTIPFDTRKPSDPSGIRLGTAAETTRGKKEMDMKKIAKKIDHVLRKSIK